MNFNPKAHFFIAVPIPMFVKEYLYELSETFQQTVSYKNWTHLQDFHITLSFLGGTRADQLKEINDGLLELKQKKVEKFELQLNHLGFFGQKNAPRVLWVGVENQPKLQECHKAVATICEKAGFHHEKRPYRPHITLGKKWANDQQVDMDALIQAKKIDRHYRWTVNEISLYQINLNQQPKYEAMGHYELF